MDGSTKLICNACSISEDISPVKLPFVQQLLSNFPVNFFEITLLLIFEFQNA